MTHRSPSASRRRSPATAVAAAPGDSTPGDSTPGDSTPGDSTPGDSTPGDFVAELKACDERMRALAYSVLGSSQAMDDVLQTAYLKAYRAYGRFRGESSFATWLGSIVFRCCMDHGRSLSRHRSTPVESGRIDHLTDAGCPAEAVDAHLDVMAALRQLSPDHRAVLILVDLEGLTMTETAMVLGVPQGTAASRLNRARAALRRVLTVHDEHPAVEESR